MKAYNLTVCAVLAVATASSCSQSDPIENPEVQVRVIDNDATEESSESKTSNSKLPDSLKLLDDLSPDSPSIQAVFDEKNTGEIESPLSADIWTFQATEGQSLTLELHEEGECFLDTQVVLTSPTGDRFEVLGFINGDCKVHGPIDLTETGQYAIEFIGGPGDLYSATGTYVFTPRLI